MTESRAENRTNYRQLSNEPELSNAASYNQDVPCINESFSFHVV